ncbi:hypothetical protein HRED_03172 [Candidatus Haloredivivus sp. G17]|nr:hypothetical protein HRED_03172 [Candidatus Haloredivivus sp. G17]
MRTTPEQKSLKSSGSKTGKEEEPEETPQESETRSK